ncbi:MAG: hypothetical protein AAGJ18_01880 [Bacteroidota bacterium]
MSLNITAADLYKSILYRAADIYEVDYEDVERDVGQKFDPIIRFMAGATASELERVYAHIYDTETRLQKRLAKVLLPEYFHLPQPAHALATATAASESIIIDETTAFIKQREEEENDEDIAFAPVLPTKILPATIKVIATETQVLDRKRRPNLRRNKKGEQEEAKCLYVGIDTADMLTNWQGASLFFDLKGKKEQESERARFFAAIKNSQCQIGKHWCTITNGLPNRPLILEDYLNGNERLQSLVLARYQRHFITFTDQEIEHPEAKLPSIALQKWFSPVLAETAIDEQLAKLDDILRKPLIWLKVVFSRPMEIEELASRLVVRLNVFPVVNRKLNGQGRGEHHYLQNNSIKWIPLQPKEDFVSIRRVYEEKPPEYPIFTFKPFADFKEERKPAYTLRHGGVGRWDDFNAWQRLAYVVNILQDNYKANELIEKAADALSLEDVHHLLGKKIATSAAEEKPTKDIYVLLHSGVKTGLRVRVEYWTSQGAAANDVPANATLRCISKQKSDLDKDSIGLITACKGGRMPLNNTQQLDAMKSALLSRGRIVTREDVKIFCQSFLLDKLMKVEVQDGVGTDIRFDFGMTRLLEVILTPTKKSAREDDWEGICQQVQTLLEENAASSIPIRVRSGAVGNFAVSGLYKT